MTTSLGLAELQPKETPGQVIERADQALYSAKKDGCAIAGSRSG